MTASNEVLKIFLIRTLEQMEYDINDFIKNNVSKVVDLRIEHTDPDIYHAYLRYIPQ